MSRRPQEVTLILSNFVFSFLVIPQRVWGAGGIERIEGGQKVNGVRGSGGARERGDEEDKINLIAIQSRSFLDTFIKTN